MYILIINLSNSIKRNVPIKQNKIRLDATRLDIVINYAQTLIIFYLFMPPISISMYVYMIIYTCMYI